MSRNLEVQRDFTTQSTRCKLRELTLSSTPSPRPERRVHRVHTYCIGSAESVQRDMTADDRDE